MKFVRLLLLTMLSRAGRAFRHTFLARWTWVNKAHGAFTLWIYGSNEVNIGPFHVRFDPRDRAIGKKLALYGNHEDDEITLLCSLVKPGAVVVDVGANFGLHSLFLARAVGPNGTVIAFEPDPDNYALLSANLKSNSCTNVIPMRYALGDKSEDVQLFQVRDNRGNLSLADHQSTGQSITVPMRRGDEILKSMGLRSSLAKIDVEGAEPFVLAGLGALQPETILFEFAPKFIRALKNDPETFLNSLSSAGYALELIDPYKHARTRLNPPEIMTHTNQFPFIWNILALRDESTICPR